MSFVKLNGSHDNLCNNSEEWNGPIEMLISQQQLLTWYQTNYYSYIFSGLSPMQIISLAYHEYL